VSFGEYGVFMLALVHCAGGAFQWDKLFNNGAILREDSGKGRAFAFYTANFQMTAVTLEDMFDNRKP